MHAASGVVGSAVGRHPKLSVPFTPRPSPGRIIHTVLPIRDVDQYTGASKRAHTCHATAEDAAAIAADAAATAAAAERRRLREQRRAARQQELQQQYAAEDDQANVQPSSTPLQTVADTTAAVQTSTGTSTAAADTTASQARRPGSRLAARQQQRAAELRGGKRRVPEALVPDDLDDLDAGGEDDDTEDDWGSSSSSAGDSFDEDEFDAADADAAAADSSSGPSSASPADAGGDAGEPDEAPTQLPQSVLQQAAAQPGRRRQQQQQHQQQQHGDPSATAGSSPQQQGQQRGGVRGERVGGGSGAEPLELSESSPMYLPVLTDEDLEADPPGHKSGYVAVIGRPNAGKSTLINAIVGQKLSIVTYKPQTTRHRVVGIASDTDYQMILFDTPGIMQEQRSKLDERMMAAVVSSIKAAEVILAVVDANDNPQEALAMFQPGPDWSGPPMAVLLNKTDLLTEQQVQELQDWYLNNCRAEKVFVGSALEGSDQGVEGIKAWAVDKLPEGPTLYPKSMVSEQPERFFVSEIIREQIFVQYDQEIPYSCQVQIADFKERRGAKDYIQAVILVERETQAPIVLGRGGAAIKKLGSAARQQIEEFLGRKVYLELSVQVAPAWRQQADKLKDFGYYDALYVS